MITTRFNYGDTVFIYNEGKMIEKKLEEVSASENGNGCTVRYGFKFSNQPGTPLITKSEAEVFATKEEILTK